MSTNTARRRRAIATTSWVALGVAMAWSPALAQTPANGNPVDANGNTVADVIVVGARASQQSSIDRKKRAATPTDSIVADDVGSFPDRSITEAISRVAGTALSRNDFGEGEGVSIRGASMGQTRVELDGMGVQSTYGLALGTGARAADMRELPSDLIKSVDIVKGSTADMTEGSLTGAIKIQTRSGLDFKKPYVSLRIGAEQNSVTEKWTPDYNLVASRKFLDGRLGVIFTGSYRGVENVSHTQETTGSNANDGFAYAWDWDNSPEKTYVFNPNLVGGATGDTPFANSTETPRTLLAKSGAAATKADCLTAFPFITDTVMDPKNDYKANYAAGNANPAGGPALTKAQADALNTANAALNSAANTVINTGNNRKTQRLNEQYTCLNQWNDLSPGNIRSFMNSQTDKRKSMDLRFDYRVSDSLTVFAKVNRSERLTDDQNRSRTLGNADVNPTGRFFTTNGDLDSPAQRYVNQDATGVGAGYFNWTLANLRPTAASCPTLATPGAQCPDTAGRFPADTANPQIGRGSTNGGITINPVDQAGQVKYTDDVSYGQTIPVRGMVVNIDPASVVVDANHAVTAYTQYNNSVTIDQIDNYQPSKTSYAQIGGDYDGDRLRVEFMAGMTKATSTRIDMRTNRSYNYGTADLSLTSGGTWNYDLPDTYDDTNPDNFVQVTAPLTPQGEVRYGPRQSYATPSYTTAERPEISPSFGVTVRPRAGESEEKQAKVDLTYDLSDFSPFLTRLKTGVSYRNNIISSWAGGGATLQEPVGTFDNTKDLAANVALGYQPGIYLPSANVSGTYRACRETNISKDLDDGIKGTNDPSTKGLCNFGFVQPDPWSRQGVDTLTVDEMKALFRQTTEVNGMRFFNSYESSGVGWNGIDTSLLFSQLGQGQYVNLDCLYECTASDGKVYEQPVTRTEEATIAAYAMLDFEAENLPFGMTFQGNVGIRGVHVKTDGTGQLTLQNIRVTGRDVNGALTLDTRTFRQNITLSNETIDWLPSYNANLWVIPDQVVVRYYYGKTITRPDINRLTPTGTCIIDERNEATSAFFDGTDESSCSGTIGNPALKPVSAVNQSVNLEWYPNRDTTLSLVYQKTDIEVGGAQSVPVEGPLFRGSGQVDPLTGRPLDNLIFGYNTWQNTPGFQRTGLEFTAKTAFSFLPSFLRYTGADFNYSTLKSSLATDADVDPITGDLFPPRGESEYYANLSLWYDDGRLQIRVANQTRAAVFEGIGPFSGSTLARNFPTASTAGGAPPYYPGQPRYRDETKYWDAKVSYNVNDNVQVFVEGTNLTKQATTSSTGGYRSYEDGTPTLWRLAYSGMRVRTGVTFKFQ